MRITELWRYPVKSLQGERIDAGELTPQGLAGDRQYAIFDTTTGFGLTARRFPELLYASARLRDDGTAEITLPDGSVAADDEALSRWLGRPVALRSTAEVTERRYENPDDAEDEEGTWQPFDGASGAFHDSEHAVVSILGTATMRDWAPRRFRANVLVEGSGEDELVGSQVRAGGAVLDVTQRIARCVMVTRPQPDGIDRDLTVLRTVHREAGGCLSVGADVLRPGPVRVGDDVLGGAAVR